MFTTPLSKENGESAYGFVMSSNLYLVGADATIDQKAYTFKEAGARVIVFTISNVLDRLRLCRSPCLSPEDLEAVKAINKLED